MTNLGRSKVFVAKPVSNKVIEYISKYCDCEMWDSEKGIPRDVLLEKMKDVDGLITSGIKVDEKFLNSSPKLKVISNMAVGYDNFDIDVMKKRNIVGTNTPNVLDDSVADLIFALVLSSARRVVEMDRYVRKDKWRASDEKELFGIDVHHKTMGIIGMGRIGEAVAKRARLGFDMDVLYYNRHRKPKVEESLDIKYAGFETILKKSDFVILMTPLTKETYRIMDHHEFEMMKSTAIFINASRGQTVNEMALIGSLKNGDIRAAGLDVFEHEPIKKDNPLLEMENVVLLPHLGSATEKTRFDMAMMAAESTVKVLQGQKCEYIVPELKEKTESDREAVDK